MLRERTLAALAVGVVAAILLGAAALPGAIADPGAGEPQRPGDVSVQEVSIAPGTVTGETAELTLDARVLHRGNAAENVSVRFRAIDGDSGLVEATETVRLGEVAADGEVELNGSLVVAREGGYRIETVVFRGNDRVDRSTTSVSGVEALTPEYARTGVGFAETSVLQPVSVAVESVDRESNRTTLRVDAAVTNRADDPSADVKLTVVLRQAESNVVADRSSVAVGSIRPGRTDTAETTVTVPDGYNYYVDAVLWHDGVLVDEIQSVANLDPEERIASNETTRSVAFEVEDFESDEGAHDERADDYEREAVEEETPGFGALAAIAGLLAVLIAARVRGGARR